MTSHLLGDISGIASRATLLARGEVVRRGDLDELLRQPGRRTYEVEGDAALDDVVREAVERAGGRIASAGPTRTTIEELFVDTYRDTEPAGEPGEGTP